MVPCRTFNIYGTFSSMVPWRTFNLHWTFPLHQSFTFLKIKVLHWHKWFHVEPSASMVPLHQWFHEEPLTSIDLNNAQKFFYILKNKSYSLASMVPSRTFNIHWRFWLHKRFVYILEIKVLHWHRWFHVEPSTSMEPFHYTKGSL